MRRLLTAVPGQDAVDARLLELQSAENELGALDAELRLIDEQLVAAEQEKTASKEGR